MFFSRIVLMFSGNSRIFLLERSDNSRGSENNKTQEAISVFQVTKIYNIYCILSDFTGFYSEMFKRTTMLDNNTGYRLRNI